jgi:hypothetical protein
VPSISFTPINPALHAAVRAYYLHCVRAFIAKGHDLNSKEFFSDFSYVFIPNEEAEQAGEEDHVDIDESELQHKTVLLDAAFSIEFEARTRLAVDVVFERHSGGTPQSYFLELVSDFLNFVIPRCAGLEEHAESERFRKLYEQFEADLYSGSFTVEATAVMRGFTDNTGHFCDRNGVTLVYYMPPTESLAHPHLRDEMVPYLEFRRASCERFDDQGPVLVLICKTRIPMKEGASRAALQISRDMIQKFVLATRLVLNTPVYSDFRAHRMIGSLGAGNFLLEHLWWEQLDSDNTPALGVQLRLERVFELLRQIPYERIAVIDWKIEDAFRRYKHEHLRGRRTKQHIEIEQLLDYVQAVEAILDLDSAKSEMIARYVAHLLIYQSVAASATIKGTFEFVHDMYLTRNDVAHGHVDRVLNGTSRLMHGNKINIWRLQGIVNELAILFIANLHTGAKLRRIANRLCANKPTPLVRI